MKLVTTLAGVLVTLATAAPAFAQSDRWGGSDYYDVYDAPRIIRQNQAELRVVPPQDGTVWVYDGMQPIARFDEPGSTFVPAGRTYGVVAMRGERRIWSGHVVATGANVTVAWPRQQMEPGSPMYSPGYGPYEQSPRYYLEPPAQRQQCPSWSSPQERPRIRIPSQ